MCLRFCGTIAKPDRKSTRLNSSHVEISYAVFCLKKKNKCGTAVYSHQQTTNAAPQTECALSPLDRILRQPPLTRHNFFFNEPATTEIYTLSLHDALPISACRARQPRERYERERVAREFARAIAEKRSEEHTSELQSRRDLVCRLLLE